MKIILLVATFVTGFTTSGCIVYERRTVPNRVVVQETIVSPAPRVSYRLCPRGYPRSRLPKPSTITITITWYHRQAPAGGYEVIARPW